MSAFIAINLSENRKSNRNANKRHKYKSKCPGIESKTWRSKTIETNLSTIQSNLNEMAKLGAIWHSLYDDPKSNMTANDKFCAVIKYFSKSTDFNECLKEWKMCADLKTNVDFCICSRYVVSGTVIINITNDNVLTICVLCCDRMFHQLNSMPNLKGLIKCSYCCRNKIKSNSKNLFCNDCWKSGERLPSDEYINMFS
jgi:hypothetical protein